MPIPSFGPNGLIPPFVGADPTTVANRSPYFAQITEVAEMFGTTAERRALLKNLISYRTILAEDGYISGVQFIDGSFVENVEATAKRSPNDIDVFSILHLPAKYSGAGQEAKETFAHFWQEKVANRDHNKQQLKLDTYALLVEEMSLGGLLQAVMYWQSLFSHQRDTYAWKGFLAIMLNPEADQAAIALLEGA